MSKLYDTRNETGEYSTALFPINKNIQHDFNKETLWVKSLLNEFNQDADEASEQEILNNSDLNIEVDIVKKFKAQMGEYFIIKAQVYCQYVTKCVHTLKDMRQSIELEVKACFIDLSLEGQELYKDQTEIFIEQDMYELYFYADRQLALKEVISELCYLEMDQYPSLQKELEQTDQTDISQIKQ